MAPPILPYGRQTIEDDDIAAVAEALRSDFLTTGPRVEMFEQDFSEAVGARYAIACSNGTAALHLAMLALGVQSGDAVIAPSITFLATANCARYVGAEVVFADVDPQSGLMTPETLAEALSRVGGRRLRAVLPVHLRGDVCDLPALAALAEQSGAVLVEDAPHALGSTMRFGSVAERVGDGRHAAMATFSFHPVKTIATGEGGMVTTNDAGLAERLRTMRSHGMVRPADADPWWYEMSEPGFNYRLPDVLCALGQSQLRKLPRFAERRRKLAKAYEAALVPLAPLVQVAGSGSCRDYATLFIEACRCLGLASRFVSGYLHAPATEAGNASTHAWAEVYLPGKGWQGFDPTVGEITGNRHIAVAVARNPEAVPPVSGSFVGPGQTLPRMVVNVQVNLLT